jgi:hypothetical protein
MRALAISEISFVSGGIEEVVVTAPRIKPGVIVITDRMAILNLFDQMDSGGGGTPRAGVWWAAVVAIVATEAKDVLEDYIKERSGYENITEWLKGQLDEMGRHLIDNTCGLMSNGKTVAPKPCGVPARD